MKTLAYPLRSGFLAALATIAVPCGATYGETFSADLTLTATPGLFGEYLAAPFDFGVRFASIQSVRLELNIPGGYEGTAVSTGNSSLFRNLFMQVHDANDPPPSGHFAQYLATSQLNIPPAHSAEFPFGKFAFGPGGEVTQADWPAFLFAGRGAVSLIDETTSYSHPLPDGVGSRSTTSWLPPLGIDGARLIVEATPIPEPTAGALALMVPLAFRRRHKK